MKVAVTAPSPNIDDAVDPRFGRCPYFLIVDTETMESEAVENPYLDASGGAGIQSAQLVASKGARAVLTGNCGPNAFQTLTAAGVEVVTGISGTIRAAVKNYASGPGLRAADQANVPSHFGMGAGMGRGMGTGTGRGMGMGRGRGAGQGNGPGRGGSSPAFPPPAPEEGDLTTLKEEARNLREHLERITKKIADLEKYSHKEPK